MTGWRVVRGKRARKLWIVVDRRSVRFPRIAQWPLILACAVRPHQWSPWRRETEDWFEYVDGPVPWAWRICRRCHVSERVVPVVPSPTLADVNPDDGR